MDANEKAKNTQTVLQSVTPTRMPTDGDVMTLMIDYPPGDPGIPPHRHLGGPCVRYVLAGAKRIASRDLSSPLLDLPKNGVNGVGQLC